MATVKSRQDLPDRAKLVVDAVERLGFKWEYDYEHPLPDYERKRVQIRDEKHYTPPAQVTQFKEALRRGDKFPPLITSKDDYLIDGNTRTEAARRNGWPTFPAVVLDQPYETANVNVKHRMHLLGAGLNNKNGKGIDKEEIRKVVEFVGEGAAYEIGRIAEHLGAPEHLVKAYLAEKKARDRAARQHVAMNGALTASQLRILGTTKLNDEPWKALAGLVEASGMAPTDLRQLIKDVRECGSDQKALALLEREREAREEQIAEFKASGKTRSPGAHQLRQHLGFIIGYGEGPTGLIERNAKLAERHLQIVEQGLAVLSAVAAQQRTMIEAPIPAP